MPGACRAGERSCTLQKPGLATCTHEGSTNQSDLLCVCQEGACNENCFDPSRDVLQIGKNGLVTGIDCKRNAIKLARKSILALEAGGGRYQQIAGPVSLKQHNVFLPAEFLTVRAPYVAQWTAEEAGLMLPSHDPLLAACLALYCAMSGVVMAVLHGLCLWLVLSVMCSEECSLQPQLCGLRGVYGAGHL